MFTEEKTFDTQDYTKLRLTAGEYETCTFINCDFSNSNLSETKFTDCEFLDCNISLAILNKTAFRDVTFRNSKMLGLRFDHCSEFGLSFTIDNCNLNHSSFYKTKLKKIHFKNSQLQETDFTDCDLSSAVFDNCDLAKALFENTILEKTDFRTAFNYSIDPENNQLKKARFSLPAVTGLLDKYGIEIENSK